MNKTMLAMAVAAMLALAACRQQAQVAEPVATPAPEAAAKPAMPAAPEAADVIDGYVDAWNAHDADKAGSFFAEDGVYFDASVGDPQRGRQAAIDNVIKVFLGAVPDAVWSMRSEPIATADGIAFEWTFAGTNTGDWSPTTKATGKAIKFDGVSFVRIKDGKIVYQGDYYDAATLNKQLGW